MVARIGFDALFSPGTMDGSIKQKSFRLKYINWDDICRGRHWKEQVLGKWQVGGGMVDWVSGMG